MPFINSKFVKFSEFLNLYQSQICPYDIDMKYKLCAVVQHLGGTGFGHYITKKRNINPINKSEPTSEWLICNDSIVAPIELSDVLSTQAYMLLYEKCD